MNLMSATDNVLKLVSTCLVGIALLVALFGAACTAGTATPSPTALASPTPSQTAEPAEPTATLRPTRPTEPTPTASSTVTNTPITDTPAVDRVQIFLVAEGDNGESGEKIGCNDSIVPVDVDIGPTQAPLTAALEMLLSLQDRAYGQSGLTNALHRSDLTIERVAMQNGTATVELRGMLVLAGVCDNPRIEAQLEKTALQFPTVTEVDIFINGRPLEDVLSLRSLTHALRALHGR